MSSAREKTRFMIFITMLISIQIILMLTPLGFIPLGPGARITTMHIPVILSGILLGVKGGSILGLVFGISSVVTNTVTPGPTSIVFSPFAPPIAGYSGNFWSLVIAIGPRVLLGVLSALIYKFFKDKNLRFSGSMITALICTIIHTLSVLGLIYVFFGDAFANAVGVEQSALLTFLIGMITTNGLFEAIVAAVAIPALVKVLEPMVKKVM